MEPPLRQKMLDVVIIYSHLYQAIDRKNKRSFEKMKKVLIPDIALLLDRENL